QLRGRQPLRGPDLHHRDVGESIGADQTRWVRLAGQQGDLDLLRALHHVVVGKDVAVRADDHPGTRAFLWEDTAARLHLRPGVDSRRMSESLLEEDVIIRTTDGNPGTGKQGNAQKDSSDSNWSDGGKTTWVRFYNKDQRCRDSALRPERAKRAWGFPRRRRRRLPGRASVGYNLSTSGSIHSAFLLAGATC